MIFLKEFSAFEIKGVEFIFLSKNNMLEKFKKYDDSFDLLIDLETILDTEITNLTIELDKNHVFLDKETSKIWINSDKFNDYHLVPYSFILEYRTGICERYLNPEFLNKFKFIPLFLKKTSDLPLHFRINEEGKITPINTDNKDKVTSYSLFNHKTFSNITSYEETIKILLQNKIEVSIVNNSTSKSEESIICNLTYKNYIIINDILKIQSFESFPNIILIQPMTLNDKLVLGYLIRKNGTYLQFFNEYVIIIENGYLLDWMCNKRI
jgi:hypothetical protein